MTVLFSYCADEPGLYAWVWAAIAASAVYPTAVSIRMIRSRRLVWSRDGRHALEGRGAAFLGWTVLLFMAIGFVLALHAVACAFQFR
jgi:hypothetical protein